MKIEKVRVVGYKHLSTGVVELHPRLNVVRGVGKTAFLQGIALAAGSGLIEQSGIAPFSGLTKEDGPAELEALFDCGRRQRALLVKRGATTLLCAPPDNRKWLWGEGRQLQLMAYGNSRNWPSERTLVGWGRATASLFGHGITERGDGDLRPFRSHTRVPEFLAQIIPNGFAVSTQKMGDLTLTKMRDAEGNWYPRQMRTGDAVWCRMLHDIAIWLDRGWPHLEDYAPIILIDDVDMLLGEAHTRKYLLRLLKGLPNAQFVLSSQRDLTALPEHTVIDLGK